MPSNSSHPWLAVGSLLVAATLWGVLWYPVRLLEQEGLPGIWTTLIAYAAASVVGVGWVRGGIRDFRRSPAGLLGLALAAGWCNVAFILALAEGTVVRVVLLFYLSPVWTVVLGRAVLGERIELLSGLVLVVAMTGALLMLWDPAIGAPWPQDAADWYALSAGFAFAVNNVIVRGLQRVSLSVKTAAAWWGGALMALAWLGWTLDPVPAASALGWWGAAGLGAVGIVVMTVTVVYGVTHLPVRRSAVILLFELVAAGVSSHLLADEQLALREWAGGLLIVGAALVAAWRGGKRQWSESAPYTM